MRTFVKCVRARRRHAGGWPCEPALLPRTRSLRSRALVAMRRGINTIDKAITVWRGGYGS